MTSGYAKKRRAAGGGAGRRGHGVMEVQTLSKLGVYGAPSLEHYGFCQQQFPLAIARKVHFAVVPRD
jgi:hypothetical protein